MNHLIHTAAPIPASPRSRIPLLARVLPSRAFRDGGGVGDLGGLRGLIAITLLVSASLGSSQGLLMGQTDEQANEQSPLCLHEFLLLGRDESSQKSLYRARAMKKPWPVSELLQVIPAVRLTQ